MQLDHRVKCSLLCTSARVVCKGRGIYITRVGKVQYCLNLFRDLKIKNNMNNMLVCMPRQTKKRC
jgi:hypothetical protein